MASQMKQLTKFKLAEVLNISRSFLYYQSKQKEVDKELKKQIELVMALHSAYGHKRIALAFGLGKINRKRVLRVMKKFNLEPVKSRRKPRKRKDENKTEAEYINLVGVLPKETINMPNLVWAADFTYLKFNGSFIYLATVLDQFTREVIGWNIASSHNKALIIGALIDALENNKCQIPRYLHSDQGSEYDNQAHLNLAESLGIKISMSRKQSPWENPYQESFYSHFKLELGKMSQFNSLGELIENIHQTINYYNNQRIHTALKMPPAEFRKQFEQTKTSDCVS